MTLTFQAPIGYRHENVKGFAGKLLVRDEPMASIIQEALEGYASGRFQTQMEVHRFLQAQPGVPKWIGMQEVTRILTRPLYAGMVECREYNVPLRKADRKFKAPRSAVLIRGTTRV